MYSGGYSQAKFSLDAKKMQRSKGKSCGYYWRVVFFFSSLIQSLIIVSLVLFMVYGHPKQSSEERRVEELQEGFASLTTENRMLRQERRNLTQRLNVTLTKKLHDDRDLRKLRFLANYSSTTIINLNTKLYQFEMEKRKSLLTRTSTCSNNPSIYPNQNVNVDSRVQQMEMMRKLLQTNFTQTAQHLTRELDGASRARDGLRLEVIGLRRNATDLQRQLDAYGRKCREDFAQSLGGIQTVTRTFINRIDGLFPAVFPFQLTCQKQKEQLDEIRTNCSSLSRDVEAKFQTYLDNVGAQVSQIQGRSSQLQALTARLQEDLGWCRQNRTAAAVAAARRSQEAQRRSDVEVERLLQEQRRLREQRELQLQSLALKASEAGLLKGQIQRLNASLTNCIPRPPVPKPGVQFPGGTSVQQNPYQRPSTGVNIPGLTKPGMTGPGGTGMNFPGMVGTGMSLPGMVGTGINFPGLTKPGMIGPGVGTGMNVQGGGGSYYYDVLKHVKELQEMANKESGVSG